MSKFEIYYNGNKSYFQCDSKYITHYSDNVQNVCGDLAISASANYDTYSGFITTQNKINVDIETTYKNISDDLTAMNNLISDGITNYEQQITLDYSEIYTNINNYADNYKKSLSNTIDKLFDNTTYGYRAVNTAFTTYRSTMNTNIKNINTKINNDTTDIKIIGKYLESLYGTQNYWSDFEDAISDII